MARKALRFGRYQHLIGVIHEAENSQQAIGILMWNTGISHRIGPFRIHVDLAERLAALGYTILRFDLSGLGDSDHASSDEPVQQIFTRDINDAREVLAQQFELQKIVSIGICSGAVDAFYHAQQDPMIQGLVMVDTFVYSTFLHELIFLCKRIASPLRWLRFIRRLLPTWSKSSDRLPGNDFLDANYPEKSAAIQATQTLIDRGVQMLVVYTGGFQPWYSYRHQFKAMLKGVKFGKGLRLEFWPKVDHLFTMLEDREKFLRCVQIWLQEAFVHSASEMAAALPATIPMQTAEPALDIPSDPVLEKQSVSSPTVPDRSVEPPGEPPAIDSAELARLLQLVLETSNLILFPSQIEADDNFFDFGGNSVLAVKLSTILGEKIDRHVPITLIYNHLRPRAVAVAICQEILNNPLTALTPNLPPAAATGQHQGSDAVAIIGMACKVPGARNIDEFWQLVVNGREGFTHFEKSELDASLPEDLVNHVNYVASRGIIDGDRFDHEFFGINRREAEFLDPQQRVLLETCWQALEDAGWAHRRQGTRVGVYVGVGSNTYQTRNLMMGHAQPHSEEEYFATMGNDKDFVATHIAYHLDLRGPAVSVHTACSTSLVAVIEGIKTLLTDDADIVLAGAAAVNAPMASGHLYQEGSIFSGDGHCRPFSAQASGTLFSDGSAVVVLKKLDRALADGDPIHAVIHGWALNNDGRNKSSFAAPSSEGQSLAIRKAYQRAGWSPQTVRYMECHGTATPIGDPIEIEGLRLAFQSFTDDKAFCALGSVKANIGHLTAAAGTIGLIKTALVVKNGLVPPAINATPINPELRLQQSPFFIPQTVMPWNQQAPRRAGVSSFGVGGTNAHVLLEAHTPAALAQEKSTLDPWLTLSWSAKDPSACQRFMQDWPQAIKAAKDQLPDLCFVSSRQRSRFHYRQSISGRNSEELLQSLGRLKKVPSYYPAKIPAMILMFPGQGSQYPGMGKDLARVWPRFAEHYERLIEMFCSTFDFDLRMALDGVVADGSPLLNATQYTQPALFCVEWALAKSLMESGLTVNALIGHSIGEVTAAAIAEVFSLQDALHLVYHRARVMQSAAPGAMLAVRASKGKLKDLLPNDLSICAINGIEACVIGGAMASIEAVLPLLKSKGLPFKQLETSHAFHSSMMDQVTEQFRAALQKIVFHPAKYPIISTVDGCELTQQRIGSIDYWVEQIRQPVNFLDAVKFAAGKQDALFLEVGPRDALSRFVRQILRDEGRWPAQALLAKSAAAGGEETTFKEGMSELANYGIQLFVPTHGQKISTPPYPFLGEKIWLNPTAPGIHKSKFQETRRPIAVTVNAQRTSNDGLEAWHKRLVESLSKLSGLEVSQLTAESTWMALGLDSLLLTQWSLKLQKEWGINMNLNLLQDELINLRSLSVHMQNILPIQTQAQQPAGVADERPQIGTSIGPVLRDHIHIMTKQIELLSEILHRQDAARPAAALVRPTSSQHSTAQAKPAALKLGSRPLPPENHDPLPNFLNRLVHEGEIEFATDQGVLRMPRYRGSFLAIGEDGQPGLFIENPEQAGEYWQVATD